MVTPLLTLITQDISINNDIGVAYTVSIHMWLMFLEAFVYLAIIEYAVAIAWAHLVVDQQHHAKKLENVSISFYDIVKQFIILITIYIYIHTYTQISIYRKN